MLIIMYARSLTQEILNKLSSGEIIFLLGTRQTGKTTLSKLISEALQVAGIDPADISYIETHGTGTTLGDAIEFEGLKRAFGDCDGKKGFCAIGSVKTNIGHLDAAAGIAGLIKTSLALKHKKLPPSLNFKSPVASSFML